MSPWLSEPRTRGRHRSEADLSERRGGRLLASSPARRSMPDSSIAAETSLRGEPRVLEHTQRIEQARGLKRPPDTESRAARRTHARQIARRRTRWRPTLGAAVRSDRLSSVVLPGAVRADDAEEAALCISRSMSQRISDSPNPKSQVPHPKGEGPGTGSVCQVEDDYNYLVKCAVTGGRRLRRGTQRRERHRLVTTEIVETKLTWNIGWSMAWSEARIVCSPLGAGSSSRRARDHLVHVRAVARLDRAHQHLRPDEPVRREEVRRC